MKPSYQKHVDTAAKGLGFFAFFLFVAAIFAECRWWYVCGVSILTGSLGLYVAISEMRVAKKEAEKNKEGD